MAAHSESLELFSAHLAHFQNSKINCTNICVFRH
jgi:hypothetical protein